MQRGRGRGRPTRAEYVARPYPVDPEVARLREALMVAFPGNPEWPSLVEALRQRLHVLAELSSSSAKSPASAVAVEPA